MEILVSRWQYMEEKAIHDKPIVIDKNYEVLDGSHRITARKLLGKKYVKAYIPIVSASSSHFL